MRNVIYYIGLIVVIGWCLSFVFLVIITFRSWLEDRIEAKKEEKRCECNCVETTDVRKERDIYYHVLCNKPITGR